MKLIPHQGPDPASILRGIEDAKNGLGQRGTVATGDAPALLGGILDEMKGLAANIATALGGLIAQ